MHVKIFLRFNLPFSVGDPSGNHYSRSCCPENFGGSTAKPSIFPFFSNISTKNSVVCRILPSLSSLLYFSLITCPMYLIFVSLIVTRSLNTFRFLVRSASFGTLFTHDILKLRLYGNISKASCFCFLSLSQIPILMIGKVY